jgi:Family of unknown function (DUF5344)
MSEIKIIDQAVQTALDSLKQSSQDFEGDFTIEKGQNVLDLMNSIETINQSLNELIDSYRNLLLQNENTARRAVETLKETDQAVASSHIKVK